MSGQPWLHPGYSRLADGGFALEAWLHTPYPEEELASPKKKVYNFSVCSPRAVVENAFGLLKGRWCVLHKGVSCETEFAPFFVEAYVHFHSFLTNEGDAWADAVDTAEDGDATAAADVVNGDKYAHAVHLRDDLAQAL